MRIYFFPLSLMTVIFNLIACEKEDNLVLVKDLPIGCSESIDTTALWRMRPFRSILTDNSVFLTGYKAANGLWFDRIISTLYLNCNSQRDSCYVGDYGHSHRVLNDKRTLEYYDMENRDTAYICHADSQRFEIKYTDPYLSRKAVGLPNITVFDTLGLTPYSKLWPDSVLRDSSNLEDSIP